MTPPADPARYKNHRFPGEIISHGVWLYYRFPLSYRDVQELLLERGIDVTHEAIRQWCLKFGQDYANRLKRRRAQPGDKWHLDEVFLTIKPTVSPLLTPVASRNLLLYQSLPTRVPYRQAKARRRKDDTDVGTATKRITEGLPRFSRRVQPHGGPSGRVRRALSTGS